MSICIHICVNTYIYVYIYTCDSIFAGPTAHGRVRSPVTPWVVLLSFQTAQSRLPQGPRRPKSVACCRTGSGSIGVRVMATCDLRRILSTHSENTLNVKGLEPSIDLDFRNVFFPKGVQLKNFFGFFSPHRWGHGTL